MTNPRTEASRALRALILEKAATPQGYGACDARHLPNYKNGARVSTLMVLAGILHKAHVPTYRPRYFTTAEAAAHYIATTAPRSYEECQAIYGARYAAKRKTAIKKPRAVKPKVVKPPPEVKVLRPDYTKPAKPAKCSAEPAKCSAEPIHTASTRYINRPWIDLRAVIVPMRRIGQPDFSMSI